jgi:hypothetical protein
MSITFYKVPQPGIESFGTSITKNAFRQRLTFNERVDFKMKSNPLLITEPTPEKIKQAVSLEVLQEDLSNAGYSDLTLPEYQLAAQLLTATGILIEGRAEVILTAPVRWDELLEATQEKFIQQYGLEACLAFDATLATSPLAEE